MATRTAVLTAALSLGLTAGAASQTIVMPRSRSQPAARATVTLGADRNGNTTVDLRVQHMALPTTLTPPRQFYVAWVRAAGRTRPVGVLAIQRGLNGRLSFVTPAQSFDLLVSAENERHPRAPSMVVLRGALARAPR